MKIFQKSLSEIVKVFVLCAIVCKMAFLNRELSAFIPQGMKKVFVLNFSGTENSGVLFASVLRATLQKENLFFMADDSVLKNLEFYYPLLVQAPYNNERVSQIGELIDADGIIVGHVSQCSVQENVVRDENNTMGIETTVFFDFYYEFYGARRGDLLEKQSFSLSKTLKEKTMSFRSVQEKNLLKNSLMKEGVQKVLQDIKKDRIDFSPFPQPSRMKLSVYTQYWKKNPLSVNFFKMYSGMIAPEKQTKFFRAGDTLWINAGVKNVPQTENGEMWLEAHGLVLDKKGQIVLRVPLMIQRHATLPVTKETSQFPLTFRFQLPHKLSKGRYILKILFFDKILYSSVSRYLEFQIK